MCVSEVASGVLFPLRMEEGTGRVALLLTDDAVVE